jgi:hypothetical protein
MSYTGGLGGQFEQDELKDLTSGSAEPTPEGDAADIFDAAITYAKSAAKELGGLVNVSISVHVGEPDEDFTTGHTTVTVSRLHPQAAEFAAEQAEAEAEVIAKYESELEERAEQEGIVLPEAIVERDANREPGQELADAPVEDAPDAP